jgi:ABC-type Fe3+-hydroxamate transport system substrate-binding protein
MKTKFAVLVLLVLFGWAVVETGQLARMVDRFQRPPVRPATRQIQVLATTPEYRLVRHPLGETRVPLAPQRIVSLTNSATDSLIALGIKPVLVSTSWRGDRITPYLKDQLRDVPKLRYGETLNLEAVLAARPDLIFAGSDRDGRLYNQLSKIAPTICISSLTEGDRENRVLDVGDVLGLSAQAQARVDEFHKHLAAARETLSAEAAGKPVSFLRFRRNTCVIYTRTTMFGPLLFEQLALAADPNMPMVMSSGGWDVLSVERLSTLESEYIFMVVDRDSEVYLKCVCQTPIWRGIPAVKHGHVYRVASGTWLSGDGVLGCEAIIDDVLANVAGRRSDDAAP